MALNIKNQEVDKLVSDLAELTGESKTEVIRRALLEMKVNMSFRVAHLNKSAKIKDFLENAVWQKIPKKLLGKKISRKEEDDILGYGKGGV